jgi:hypothetical protein
VLWSSSAGHLAFPRSSKLVDDGGGALESQIVRWLRRQRDSQPE